METAITHAVPNPQGRTSGETKRTGKSATRSDFHSDGGNTTGPRVHISVLDDPDRLGRGRGKGRRDGELPRDLGDTERDREREIGDRETGEREREKERLRFLLKKEKNTYILHSSIKERKR